MAVELVEVKHRRFTVKDFHLMAKAGVFADGERVELVEGEIVEMSPIGDPHMGAVMQADYVLSRKFGDT
jgi:hypothetical protein